jgi:hypothetical protein
VKGQKQAVVEAVVGMLPNFNLYKDIALVMLTSVQLESLKHDIGQGIYTGTIEYGKDRTNGSDVFSYARSMVMNHLKKAKELNGNQIYGVGPAVVQSKQSNALNSINMDILPEDLVAFVKTLV